MMMEEDDEREDPPRASEPSVVRGLFTREDGTSIKFHFAQHHFDEQRKEDLKEKIEAGGGEVIAAVPLSGYMLYDANSAWLSNVAKFSNKPDTRFVVHYTFINECIRARRIVSHKRSMPGEPEPRFMMHLEVPAEKHILSDWIKPYERRQLRISLHQSIEVDERVRLCRLIQEYGGLYVVWEDRARIVIADLDERDDGTVDDRVLALQELFRHRDQWVESPGKLREWILNRTVELTEVRRKGMPGRKPNSLRFSFTSVDDRILIDHVARQIPEKDGDGPNGRTGNKLWMDLDNYLKHLRSAANRGEPIESEFDGIGATLEDIKYAANHTWQSWRTRYKEPSHKFDSKIERYLQKNPHLLERGGEWPMKAGYERRNRRVRQQADLQEEQDEEAGLPERDDHPRVSPSLTPHPPAPHRRAEDAPRRDHQSPPQEDNGRGASQSPAPVPNDEHVSREPEQDDDDVGTGRGHNLRRRTESGEGTEKRREASEEDADEEDDAGMDFDELRDDHLEANDDRVPLLPLDPAPSSSLPVYATQIPKGHRGFPPPAGPVAGSSRFPARAGSNALSNHSPAGSRSVSRSIPAMQETADWPPKRKAKHSLPQTGPKHTTPPSRDQSTGLSVIDDHANVPPPSAPEFRRRSLSRVQPQPPASQSAAAQQRASSQLSVSGGMSHRTADAKDLDDVENMLANSTTPSISEGSAPAAQLMDRLKQYEHPSPARPSGVGPPASRSIRPEQDDDDDDDEPEPEPESDEVRRLLDATYAMNVVPRTSGREGGPVRPRISDPFPAVQPYPLPREDRRSTIGPLGERAVDRARSINFYELPADQTRFPVDVEDEDTTVGAPASGDGRRRRPRASLSELAAAAEAERRALVSELAERHDFPEVRVSEVLSNNGDDRERAEEVLGRMHQAALEEQFRNREASTQSSEGSYHPPLMTQAYKVKRLAEQLEDPEEQPRPTRTRREGLRSAAAQGRNTTAGGAGQQAGGSRDKGKGRAY